MQTCDVVYILYVLCQYLIYQFLHQRYILHPDIYPPLRKWWLQERDCFWIAAGAITSAKTFSKNSFPTWNCPRYLVWLRFTFISKRGQAPDFIGYKFDFQHLWSTSSKEYNSTKDNGTQEENGKRKHFLQFFQPSFWTQKYREGIASNDPWDIIRECEIIICFFRAIIFGHKSNTDQMCIAHLLDIWVLMTLTLSGSATL